MTEKKPYYHRSQITDHRSGFTLIEMLVVIFIIATISTISIANFRAGERQKRSVIASDVVTLALRNAQNYTLTSKQIANSSCIQGKTPQAYLMAFIGASATTGSLYGIDKCNIANLIESYSLPTGTAISAYKIDLGVVANLQVEFTVPFAQTTVSSNTTVNTGPFNSFSTATVTVGLSDGTLARTITVDGVAGRIGE